MKQSFIGLLLFLFFGMHTLEAKDTKFQSSYQLIERILPGKSNQFNIENLKRKDKKEAFELSSKKGKIVIKGTNELSI